MHLVEKLLDTESGWYQFWQLRRNLDGDPNHTKFIDLGERYASFEDFLRKTQATQKAAIDHPYKLNVNTLSGIYLLYADLKAKEAQNPCGFFRLNNTISSGTIDCHIALLALAPKGMGTWATSQMIEIFKRSQKRTFTFMRGKGKEGRERPLLYLATQIEYENYPSLIAFTRAGFV